MYNKAESIRKRSSEESCKRRNVIVLGDSLGDVHMAAGVKDPSVVLTIGFLNHKIESSLETYKKHFDIVGAGISGLTLALLLVKLGHQVNIRLQP